MRTSGRSFDFRDTSWPWLFGATAGPRSRAAMALLSMALLGWLGWSVGGLVQARESVQAARERLAEQQAQREQRQLAANRAETALSPRQRHELERIVARLDIPWPLMLDDLERLTPRSVAVLQVEPDTEARRLKLVVEVRAAGDVFAYIEALRRARSLRQPRIVKQEDNTQAQPGQPRTTRFVLQAEIEGAVVYGEAASRAQAHVRQPSREARP
ncbi:hypothetical protein [Methylibium rhizosphaerae]|uniref:hypothetical protein n=1 Tax=Methylibium rhizosphaerae TaxID=2570323 RepID=UPI001127C314|nr:hypothetical protein [Methylibium rhizosphaerae]